MQLLKTGYSFQQPTQAEFKRYIYKNIGSLIPCGHIYLLGKDTEEPGWCQGQAQGEILQQALKPLRYLFLLFLQAKKAKSPP